MIAHAQPGAHWGVRIKGDTEDRKRGASLSYVVFVGSSYNWGETLFAKKSSVLFDFTCLRACVKWGALAGLARRLTILCWWVDLRDPRVLLTSSGQFRSRAECVVWGRGSLVRVAKRWG